MIKYHYRFWDKVNRQMIENAGISPRQQPIIQHPDGSVEELSGSFVPMLCTFQKAVNGYIWEGDVVDCDIPYQIAPDMPLSFVKARGVMQFNQVGGCFTVNIASKPENQGQSYQVTNVRIVGCAVSNPELLQVSENQNENKTNNKAESGESSE